MHKIQTFLTKIDIQMYLLLKEVAQQREHLGGKEDEGRTH